MLFDFDRLREHPVRRQTGQNQAGLFQLFPVFIVQLISVSVPFTDLPHPVALLHKCTRLYDAGITAEAERASLGHFL